MFNSAFFMNSDSLPDNPGRISFIHDITFWLDLQQMHDIFTHAIFPRHPQYALGHAKSDMPNGVAQNPERRMAGDILAIFML